jgi:hypothetical protein
MAKSGAMYFSLFIASWLCLFSASNNGTLLHKESAEEVLQKVSAKLNNLESVQYQHRRVLDYPSKDYHNELKGNIYFDFRSEDTVIGTRFYFKGAEAILAFNGSESFVCMEKWKTLSINRSPKASEFENLSFLNHSLFSLRRSLPWILADGSIPKTMKDTVIGSRPFHLLYFTMKKAAIATLGTRWSLSDPVSITYRLMVEQESLLPVELLQTNDLNSHILRTDFTDLHLNPQLPDESIL